MHLIEGAGAWTRPAGSANDWAEQLRTPDLSVGTYCIPAGGRDTQSPHTEDEIYVVTAGRARIVTPDGSANVEPGSVIFVPAGEEHRFDERLAGPEARQRAVAWRRQAATRWRSHAAGQH
jgi:mannose-6-phosphate isomerase-like protein (cupin superfamily)